ncbi:MAG: hypothetical protein JWM43_1816 [Acidobacteriaceae bacterium]|nr:hypothetical protein [Acidobacteriaceae bacterium]
MEKPYPHVEISAEIETFEFIYDGPDVANGSMNARQLALAVSGMNRVFATTAQEHNLGGEYEVRVRDIKHASFHLVWEAVALMKQHQDMIPAAITGAVVLIGTASAAISNPGMIISDIAAMITAKKRLRGARMSTLATEFIDGEVRLTVPGDSESKVVLTREQYELLLSHRVDRSIADIIAPLAPALVDRFEIRRGNIELASVVASEKDYFSVRPPAEDKGREGSEIIGAFNSLNKTSLRGTFHALGDVHVPYKYSGGDIARLLRGFSSKEPVRVFGKVRYGADGILQSIDVKDIEFLQQDFRHIA